MHYISGFTLQNLLPIYYPKCLYKNSPHKRQTHIGELRMIVFITDGILLTSGLSFFVDMIEYGREISAAPQRFLNVLKPLLFKSVRPKSRTL